MSQPLPLDEAIRALRRDPTHPVRVKVDDGLTVEVRAVEPPAPAKRDPRVAPRVAAIAAETVGMPLVVLAELLFGVEKSTRRAANRPRLERFAAGVSVLPFDLALAARYAVVRADLERTGRPKTDFD